MTCWCSERCLCVAAMLPHLHIQARPRKCALLDYASGFKPWSQLGMDTHLRWAPTQAARRCTAGHSPWFQNPNFSSSLHAPAMGARPGRATVHCWSSERSTVESSGATTSLQK